MAAISIRNLDDDIKKRLRIKAARHGRSMESEIRAILTRAVNQPEPAEGLFATLIDRFAAAGGVELDLPPRSTRPSAISTRPRSPWQRSATESSAFPMAAARRS